MLLLQGTQKLKLGRNPFSGGNAGKGGGTKAVGTSFLRSARKDPNTVRSHYLFIPLSGPPTSSCLRQIHGLSSNFLCRPEGLKKAKASICAGTCREDRRAVIERWDVMHRCLWLALPADWARVL